MMLALRATAAGGATRWQRFQSALIRWRLCSQWCHGGIVVAGWLVQSTPERGLHATSEWSPENWTLIDLGSERDKSAWKLLGQSIGTPYDWLGVLGFAVPVLASASVDRLYCFAWCALAMGMPPARWMTPERLLFHTLQATRAPPA
jgi:hypothetical protein